MKIKKSAMLGTLLILGCLLVTSYTTEAKFETVTFQVWEYSVSMEIGRQWMTYDGILQWKDVVWEFEMYGDDLIPDGYLIATANTFHINTTDWTGGGTGTNYFKGTLNVGKYAGEPIEWFGTSVMKMYGAVYGKYVSHGTLGDHKIQVRGEFYPDELSEWTVLIGEIKIFL